MTQTKQTAALTLPSWVHETPNDLLQGASYGLSIKEPHCLPVQHVAVTRDEYIALKERLAEMRGHVQPGPRGIIRQKDLELLSELRNIHGEMTLELRRRVEAGYSVEPGEWKVSSAGPIKQFDEDNVRSPDFESDGLLYSSGRISRWRQHV
jgi:hypothetical protein